MASTSRPSTRSRVEALDSWHSQTRSTRQPARRRARWLRWSRAWFVAIFEAQNVLFVPGIRPFWQRCPCQKQPSTKTTVAYLGRTRSGRPGRFPACKRNLIPRPCRKLLTRSSGLVSFPRIRDIRTLRSLSLRLSATDVVRSWAGPSGQPPAGRLARQARLGWLECVKRGAKAGGLSRRPRRQCAMQPVASIRILSFQHQNPRRPPRMRHMPIAFAEQRNLPWA